jgi:hypothetical protein
MATVEYTLCQFALFKFCRKIPPYVTQQTIFFTRFAPSFLENLVLFRLCFFFLINVVLKISRCNMIGRYVEAIFQIYLVAENFWSCRTQSESKTGQQSDTEKEKIKQNFITENYHT